MEKFIIQQKVEKVKELHKYGEMTINEIAFELNYSSPEYLSNQFKHITGFKTFSIPDDVSSREK